MNASPSACVASTTNAQLCPWDLVFRVVQGGDVQASLTLFQRLQQCLSGDSTVPSSPSAQSSLEQREPVNVCHTFAPSMLHQCLSAPAGEVPPPVVLYVCVLNRIFCLQTIAASQAQALDRRPTGLSELLGMYLGAARQRADLPMAAQRQLCLCTACLALLVYDDVTVFFDDAHRSVVEGRAAPHLYGLLLTSVMDVLTDSRVPLGSIRRATQRRRVQERLHVALASVVPHELGPTETQRALLQQVELVDKSVGFLLEGMTGEPQEVAVTFWRQLPSSDAWRWLVHCFHAAERDLTGLPKGELARLSEANVAALLPPPVVDCACHVLRCVTVMNEAAQALLLSLVPTALSLARVQVACAPACAVVASALEASTEEVVLRTDPSSAVFQLLSAAAERLVEVLRGFRCGQGDDAGGVPLEAALSACEGISALTQALTPMPIPSMEADDDPEDFASFIQSAEETNAEKAAVVGVLRPFLAGCQLALLQRLAAPAAFDEADWELVAEYVRRSTVDARPASEVREVAEEDKDEGHFVSDDEDFQVAFDDAALALFTTYERLCRLLGELPEEAVTLGVREGVLVGLCSHAPAALRALTGGADSRPPSLLLSQAALLPVLTLRFTRRAVGRASAPENGWSTASWAAVVGALSAAMAAAAQERRLDAGVHVVAAVRDVVQAADRLARRQLRAAGDARDPCELVLQLTGSLDQVLTAAWRCLLLPGQRANHWRVAEDIAALLELTAAHGAAVPSPLLNVVFKQDAHTQVAILSVCRVDSMDAFMYLLRCTQELTSPEDEQVVRMAGRRLVRRAAALLPPVLSPENGQAFEASRCHADFARALEEWQRQHPSLLVLLLQLSECLPWRERAHLRASAVFRFFSTPAAADTASPQLRAILGGGNGLLAHDVAEDLSSSAAERLAQLVDALLQPHPAFHAANAEDRIAALAHTLRSLQACDTVPQPVLARLLVLALYRCQEVVAAQSMMGSEGGAEEREDTHASGNLLDAVLSDLAVVARCVAHAAPTTGGISWLDTLQVAEDDFERRRLLKSAIGL